MNFFQIVLNQLQGESVEALAQRVLYSNVPPRDVGIVLHRPDGFGSFLHATPVSGELIIGIVALREAGLI